MGFVQIKRSRFWSCISFFHLFSLSYSLRLKYILNASNKKMMPQEINNIVTYSIIWAYTSNA